MELHQLRYLVSVVETGSFTAAGEREHVTQSGVSAQVAKLERELGHQLVERTRGSLTVTAAGAAVLPLARAALEAVDAIDEVVSELSGLLRGRVQLGMILGCSIPPFLDALTEFRRTYPGIEVRLAEGDSDSLQRQVLTGDLDLALVGYSGAPLVGLEVAVVVDEPLAVVVATDHPLAAKAKFTLNALTAESVLTLSSGTGIRSAFDASCAAAGRTVPVALEASSPDTILGLVRRGAGVGVLSPSIVGPGPDGLVVRPLAGATVTACLGLVSRRGAQPAATAALLRAMTASLVKGA